MRLKSNVSSCDVTRFDFVLKQSILICLVSSCITGFATIDMAVILSQLRVAGGIEFRPVSLRNENSQVISHAVNVMALYLAFAVERVTTFY